jgi:uncharacterized membrane protein YecN with MAPEG domain
MAAPVITAFYAGLLGIVGLFLAARVIAGRAKHAIQVGDGGREDMTLRIRAFGNFAEYVPLVLVLAALAEGLGGPRWAAHAVGAALVAGRLLHAWGLSRTPRFNAWRFAGTNLTFAALLGAAAGALALALARSPF